MAVSPRELEQQGRKTDQSPSSSAEIKSARVYTSTLVFIMRCLINETKAQCVPKRTAENSRCTVCTPIHLAFSSLEEGVLVWSLRKHMSRALRLRHPGDLFLATRQKKKGFQAFISISWSVCCRRPWQTQFMWPLSSATELRNNKTDIYKANKEIASALQHPTGYGEHQTFHVACILAWSVGRHSNTLTFYLWFI